MIKPMKDSEVQALKGEVSSFGRKVGEICSIGPI
jgi:hypothetical protein